MFTEVVELGVDGFVKGIDYTGVTVVYFCHDGKGNVVMAKRSDNTRDEHGTWDIGGGGVEFDETIEGTLKKEIGEEYCTDVLKAEFLGYRDVHRSKDGKPTHWIALDFKVLIDPVKVRIGEPHKFVDIGFFRLDNLPSPLHSQLPNFLKLYNDKLIMARKEVIGEVRKLLIATRNKNKLPEIMMIFSGLPFELVSLEDMFDLSKDYEVDEQAATFEGNAIIKAMIYGQKTGLLTLADDSGLCVDALGGRPGVYSARYAAGTAEDRNKKLLDELQGVPEDKRTARYVATVAIYDPASEKVRTCEGVCEGKITTEFKGVGGFGYDPVFFNTDLNKTMAQVTMEEKNSVSHRGKAMRLAREILGKEFI